MKNFKLKVLRFLAMFFTAMILLSLLGGVSAWELKYFWAGNWDEVPRGVAATISILFGCINSFRTDDEIL